MADLDRLWYGQNRPLWYLWPLAYLYRRIAGRRRLARERDAIHDKLPVPVIVVGNITAGGTGKSPLTAWLVRTLADAGWRPVILSRGYGGKSSAYPLLVDQQTPSTESGDEPLMLARQTGFPVVVDPKRLRAARWSLDQDLGDVFVCGLQHYALPRDIEIALIDGQRGLGNRAPLPVGPLREPPERLDSVDFVVLNDPREDIAEIYPEAATLFLAPALVRNLVSGEVRPPQWLAGRAVTAVAGIGNPRRFFRTLETLGAEVTPRPFPDHHRFTDADLKPESSEILVMTAKDAVKCEALAHPDCWVLEIEPQLSPGFDTALLERLEKLRS